MAIAVVSGSAYAAQSAAAPSGPAPAAGIHASRGDEHDARVDAIDAVLPQTQCRQCGFDGCRPYATAITSGATGIDRCPPGGTDGVHALAAVTGRPVVPLDPSCGAPKPLMLAVIDESICIGCTLCIQACPVDAIVGGAKRMHDVVADLCTGCELCVAPCPVDCIAMVAAPYAWTSVHAAAARTRHRARAARLARLARERDVAAVAVDAPRPQADVVETSVAAPAAGAASPVDRRRQAIIQAAVERAASLQGRRRPPLPTPPEADR